LLPVTAHCADRVSGTSVLAGTQYRVFTTRSPVAALTASTDIARSRNGWMWTTAIAEIVSTPRAPIARAVLMRDAFPASAPKGGAPAQGRRARARNTQLTTSIDSLATCERAEETMKTWLTVAEGAAYAGVSRDTIYTACERRELRHARIGGRRAIRIKPEWIDAWLERHARGTIAPHVPPRVPQAT
jgi:excisionase family DNA binding protein